ncbi:MAG: hypothetical protein JRN09_05260 [Nitrososphaerota archaeon]|nr:hypothetical protein [Nitrososphaerota archaeon]
MNGERTESSSGIKVLLQKYYEAVAKGGGWGQLLSEDFLLSGTIARGSVGRDAYVSNNFFKMVRGLEVKELIAEGKSGFAIVSYEVVSPKGKRFTSEVAEFWKAKDGKLASVAIYFDTAAFEKALAQ